MKKGRSAVLVKPGQLETWEIPVTSPEPGGVLVKLTLGGVCGSDVHLLHGTAGVLPFPIVLGHEGVGVIEELGEGVHTDYASQPLKVGDYVYWSPVSACNSCFTCTVLGETPCEHASFFEEAGKPNWGAYSEHVWLPKGLAFYKLPEGASPEAVVALGCALPTALRGVDQAGGIKIEDTVVIQGAGPVGLSSVLVAKEAGAREIIVIDVPGPRMDAAVALGATRTVSLKDLTAAERKQAVYDITGPAGPRMVIEAAGVLNAFPEGFDLAGMHGTYLILGLWGTEGTVPVSPRDFTIKNLRVVGATFPKPEHYYKAMMLACRVASKVPLAELVTHRFGVTQAAEALAAVESGRVVKAVIDPTLD